MSPDPRTNGNGAPWWARSVWVLGPVAIGFMLLLASALGLTPVRIFNGNGKAAAESTREVFVEWRAHVDTTNRVVTILETIQHLQRQTCINTARDSASLAGCNR